MSTSDQQEQGPLTRKQLREIRLTGSTPVISTEEAAAAVEAAPPVPPLPRAADPVDVTPAPEAPVDDAQGDAPLTRRQARELEKVRTASVPVIGGTEAESTEPPTEDAEDHSDAVTVPPVSAAPEPGDDDDVDDAVDVVPVRASDVSDSVGDMPLETTDEPAGDVRSEDDVEAVLGIADESADATDDDLVADVHDADADADADADVAEERPTVNSAFGESLLADAPGERAAFRPSFDELLTVGDSTGSQHSAPNALIFTPSPGEGSLSGPVASTGEILVTGSYELPQGMGSQGHALGTTDGKDVDAVLIDGELPPASSPTPIAASSAVSTIKPAGEVIRPPAPEKGNRLMVILAIVAGGLALAVGVAVIIAFTTNVF